MSDQPGAPQPGAGQEQPSEEEVREYLSQLRDAPVEQVVAEVCSALLNAAQVKLGRSDGRLLLDLAGTVTEQARDQLPDELTTQLDDVLSKLRMAQVEAEREGAGAGDQGTASPGDIEGPSPAGGNDDPPTGGGSGSGLWVPGR